MFVRLGWESFPETNTLAYYENSEITEKKSFITLSPVVELDWNKDKLDCLQTRHSNSKALQVIDVDKTELKIFFLLLKWSSLFHAARL